MTSVVYKCSLCAVTKTSNDVGSWLSYKDIVNTLFKASMFPIMGEKNNQSLVSNADQKSQPSGQWIMTETR